MPATLARIQNGANTLKFNERLHGELSDTWATSQDEDEEESDGGSEASDSEYDDDHSESNGEDDECSDGSYEESSSWDEDDHGALEAELARFSLDRAASCSRLGGGFPSLERGCKIPAARVHRRSSSNGLVDMKQLLVSQDLQVDDGAELEDFSAFDVSYTERSERKSVSEGLEEHIEQLKASVGSMYSMAGLTRPPKAAAPKLDGELGLVNKDDKALGEFVQTKPGQPLTIVQTESHQTTKTISADDVPKPATVLRSILKHDAKEAYPPEMWEGYFLEVQKNHIRAHTKEMELMIRCEEYSKLRTMIRNGQTLQSCNRHGESIVHLACRRNSVKLLKFLMDEAQVSVRVHDDYGRSPLHDTCWSYNDRFEIFKLLLQDSPELLFVADKRGCSPFDYIPKKRWGEWNEFLKVNADFLKRAINVVDLADMDAYYERTHSATKSLK